MRKLCWAALALPLAACVTGGEQMRWAKAGATPSDFEQEKVRCQYEATLATPGSNMGRGLGGAVASGIADGMRMAELQTLCMQSRGWQQVRVVVNEDGTVTASKGWLRKDGQLMRERPELVPYFEVAKSKCSVVPGIKILEITPTMQDCMDKQGFALIETAELETWAAEFRASGFVMPTQMADADTKAAPKVKLAAKPKPTTVGQSAEKR